jgi:hypothetical protein
MKAMERPLGIHTLSQASVEIAKFLYLKNPL